MRKIKNSVAKVLVEKLPGSGGFREEEAGAGGVHPSSAEDVAAAATNTQQVYLPSQNKANQLVSRVPS